MRRALKLQPSTALATLALFVALGGTSYAVTGGTPYTVAGQINGSQLKNRSVSGVKLEAHTLTGEEMNLAGFPKVPSAHSADRATDATTADTARTLTGTIGGKQVSSPVANATTALTARTITGTISGAQVSSPVANATNAASANTAATITGTISGTQVSSPVANATNAASADTAATITGTVSGAQVSSPVANATNAASADTAATITGTISGAQVSGAVANATNAASATHLDGDQLANISASSRSSADVTLARNLGGLSLAMRCTGGAVAIDATTSVNGASYGMSAVANAAATSFVKAEGNFNTGATVTSTSGAPAQLSFSYEQPNGMVASGTFTVFNNGGTCSAFGVAESTAS